MEPTVESATVGRGRSLAGKRELFRGHLLGVENKLVFKKEEKDSGNVSYVKNHWLGRRQLLLYSNCRHVQHMSTVRATRIGVRTCVAMVRVVVEGGTAPI